MVHCRSAMGAWKHAQRSYLRGYLSRPPVAIGVELPPPPPPLLQLSFGNVFPVPLTRSKWIDLCDEEENGLDNQQKVRPPGVVSYLVDASCLPRTSASRQPFTSLSWLDRMLPSRLE